MRVKLFLTHCSVFVFCVLFFSLRDSKHFLRMRAVGHMVHTCDPSPKEAVDDAFKVTLELWGESVPGLLSGGVLI